MDANKISNILQISLEQTVNELNILLQKGEILAEFHGEEIKYKSNITFSDSLSSEEKVILHLIISSSKNGIWSKDLKQKAGLHQTIFNKVIKSLEAKNLVSNFKCSKNSSKKMYIASGLSKNFHKPEKANPWFDENELDVEFTETITGIIVEYLRKCRDNISSLLLLHNFLIQSKITSMQISLLDTISIINKLIYDSILEKVNNEKAFESVSEDDTPERVQLQLKPLESKGMQLSTCTKCENFQNCASLKENQFFNPISCIYFENWK